MTKGCPVEAGRYKCLSWREAGAAEIGVVGHILHSFTDNMTRREIQGVGYVD